MDAATATTLPLKTSMRFTQVVIVAAPDTAESRAFVGWLNAEGFHTVFRSNPRAASDEIASQPFDLLVADAVFVLQGSVRGFGAARFRETPVIIVGDEAAGRLCMPYAAQAMFVERPTDRAMFMCMVTMALMDARPERRSPRRAVRPFEATVNGARSYIIDVSREGVRLELPRDRRMVTPQFVMRVPIIGVNVTVRRMWVRMPRVDEQFDGLWCGGQLIPNSLTAAQGWSSFIDTLPAAAAPAVTMSQID